MPPSFIDGWFKLSPELKDYVMRFLQLQDLSAYAAVSDDFRLYAVKCIRSRLTSLVKPYGFNASSAIALLTRHNAVIGGSLALELVNPTGLVPANLDFMCPRHSAYNVLDSLMRCGYVLKKDPIIGPVVVDEARGRNSIHEVGTLWNEELRALIHVVVSTELSPLAPIYSGHSTILMNFVSAHGVYSCYPLITSRRQGFRNISDTEVAIQPRRILDQEKYLARGYSYLEPCPADYRSNPSALHGASEHCLHTIRYAGDQLTACLPFDVFKERYGIIQEECFVRAPGGSGRSFVSSNTQDDFRLPGRYNGVSMHIHRHPR
ncbi:hypothetical protein DFP72DRAFT_1063437 [Ephemerocybe angulata]|uniref:Uncharacterized protein n=1 Tax=Ephemerocybe angulata TaxID=980116 RepID=A0A8H6I6X9_9AGAR|nr:hypothetical protein DFP72DRAFT_1063437 [Tulosesus angulatus]